MVPAPRPCGTLNGSRAPSHFKRTTGVNSGARKCLGSNKACDSGSTWPLATTLISRHDWRKEKVSNWELLIQKGTKDSLIGRGGEMDVQLHELEQGPG